MIQLHNEVFTCHICYRKFYDKESYLDHTAGLDEFKPKQKSNLTSTLTGIAIGVWIGFGFLLIEVLLK